MYFEDFHLSQSFESGSGYTVTKEEIIDFASRYDPQFMHIDKKRAEKGLFKRIIASGLHTMSVAMKLLVELNVLGDEVICGVSIDKAKFICPVFPEDILTLKVKVIDLEEHFTERDKGFITFRLLIKNQDEKINLSFTTKALIKRRPTKKH